MALVIVIAVSSTVGLVYAAKIGVEDSILFATAVLVTATILGIADELDSKKVESIMNVTLGYVFGRGVSRRGQR